MSDTLSDDAWDVLLRRINDGKCTPFLGAGINSGILPDGAGIAQKWAKDFHYPLDDRFDLARVAQFLAVNKDPMFPKEQILRELEAYSIPNFGTPNDPYGILADLPLPVYITTNYDQFMVKALVNRHKDPKRELCRWNSRVADCPSIFDSPSGFQPTPANPVVFHLHGHDENPESLVLTEDDYLDFLVNLSKDGKLLPPRIQSALAGASLLFIGYRLADWSFRVIFSGLVNSVEPALRRISVAVQLPPDVPERENAQKYLARYFGSSKIHVYWGTAKDFVSELQGRWRKLNQ